MLVKLAANDNINDNLIMINKEKKRTFRILDFTVSADQRVKLNESKKEDKYLKLALELKKTA